MIPYRRLNRIATIAILPIMIVTIVVVSRSVGDAGPAHAPMPVEGTLVVANLRDESLAFIPLRDPGGARTLQLPGPPHELAIAEGRLYITLGRGGAVVEVDPAAPGVLRSLRLDGEPHGLAVDGVSLLVSLDKAASLVTVDRAAMAEVTRTSSGPTPHMVVAAGGDIYLAAAGADRLDAPRTGWSAPTGAGPEGLAVAGPYVVTANATGGTLTVVRRDGTGAATFPVGVQPVRVVPLDEQRVVVSLEAAGKVAVVNLATHRIERTVAVGGRPDGICISPSRSYVAVVSNATASVTVFRLADWAVAGTVRTGEGPGSCLWLADR